ncbi:unnamed protein product (macronuclear) [Paramecium tetraurelia]|uniref:Uncharacterized protein n=1 Tax=Paramecium tetraurelia TaxID=5888 RepID=A0BI05_PARTE|nr:uncharacterized protein GSPATT00029208001 [Paramecium tetraurelia]CAK58172.1 unnamed protein product [Paramecium tetraurelia]|eukprot:XP_001425570.1 hypothetical protein (macronuclear) [Paramecium tetraurelia strain d4-2]
MSMKKSKFSSYQKIQSENRQSVSKLIRVSSMTNLSNTSTVVKLSIKELLEKQKKGEITKLSQQKENFISKIAPIKIQTQNSKNSSPRYRIKLLSSPLSTNRTTLSKSSQVSPLRQNRTLVPKDFICLSQPQIQISQIEKLEEFVSISNNSPTRIDNMEDYSPSIRTKNIEMEQEKILKEDIKPPKKTKKELKGCLLRALRKLKEMNINTKMMLQKQIFSKKPYQKPNSQEFIHAVKLNQLDKVKQYIEKNKYIIFDFDYFNMTALHWSSKKGFYEMTEFLIKNHADVDAIDILNRTPLFLAIQENNIPIIELLLRNKAYPWSTSVTDLGEAVGNNRRVRKILTQIRRVDIINMWGEKKLKEELF